MSSRPLVMVLVLSASSGTAQADTITLDLPGKLDRQSVAYACSDGSAPKVAYYNLPDQSLAVVEIEPGKPRVFVPVLAASGAKYVSGPHVFWTRGSRADILDERQADKPAVTCKVAR
jgi:membrane-bound inhibitor of C-type lysozyme